MSEVSTGASSRRRLLIVDDDPTSLDLLHSCLEAEGYVIHAARDGERAVALAARTPPDLVLLDVVMPSISGFETCRRLKQDPRLENTPVLFITARDDVRVRLEAFRAGGVDCIGKPFEPDEVRARVRAHMELASLRAELTSANEELGRRMSALLDTNEQLRREIERRRDAEAGRDVAEARAEALALRAAEQWGDVRAIVGTSDATVRLLGDVRQISPTDVSVLVVGESGTGKELVARALHAGSSRAGGPFVAINCAAIPSELVESVLFGHVKGAFSGATGPQVGYFQAASGGTLFLDEIGAMPVALQAKLLRALEEKHVTPVGATQSVPTDVRVVSATNADPATEIERGRLRQDLYFRLARYPISVPPLRERGDDIPLLASHFLTRFALEMGRPQPVLDAAVLSRLRQYAFPGNVRELRNMMEHALLRARDGFITLEHIHFLNAQAPAPGSNSVGHTGMQAPDESSRAAAAVLARAHAEGSISNQQVQDALSLTQRQASYLLGRLVAEGRLIRVGEKRWSRYELP